MFDQAFKRIDDVLRNEAGCTTELDYTEQTSWLLFLKYLDGLEEDKAAQAALEGKDYSYILDESFRWSVWAAPKTPDGKLDHNTALTGDDLRDFVDNELFPHLQGFKQKASSSNTIKYKIGEIFGEIKNKIQSGYNMREIIDSVDELRFRSKEERHELSQLYEDKIKKMGNAGRNGGEYYTPRPLIRAIVEAVDPRLGETIYDPAVGSAGFLCEAYEYLKRTHPERTTKQDQIVQDRTFYGKEKKSLAYVIAIMNLILHGIEAPNILHTNTLTENLSDVQEKDRYDVVLANPPFGGAERKEVQQNFPIRTSETAYLFLQHFIKHLKPGGRAGVVIKSTFLTNDDSASCATRKLLLDSCELEMVLDCPRGVFAAGVHTVVLFFRKGGRTRSTWFYKLDPGRNLGKSNPLNDRDLAEFREINDVRPDTARSWTVDRSALNPDTRVFSTVHPDGVGAMQRREPDEIVTELITAGKQGAKLVGTFSDWTAGLAGSEDGWSSEPLGELCDVAIGRTPPRAESRYWDNDRGTDNVWLSIADLLKADEYIVAESKEYLSDSGAALCKKVESGTLLVSFKLTLGRLAFAGRDLYTNEAIAALTVRDEAKLSKRYLLHYLSYFDWDAAAENDEKVKGKTLNKTKVKAITVHYPPLSEQERIVEKLESAQKHMAELRALYSGGLESLKELEAAVTWNAFGGHRGASE